MKAWVEQLSADILDSRSTLLAQIEAGNPPSEAAAVAEDPFFVTETLTEVDPPSPKRRRSPLLLLPTGGVIAAIAVLILVRTRAPSASNPTPPAPQASASVTVATTITIGTGSASAKAGRIHLPLQRNARRWFERTTTAFSVSNPSAFEAPTKSLVRTQSIRVSAI